MSQVQGSVSEDPGRIIYELEERLKTANATISDQTAENERLQAEWSSQFIAAQQLRSDNDRLQSEIERLRAELLQSEVRNTADAEAAGYLEGLLDNAREALRELQDDHTEMDHRAEGARSAFLAVIKMLWEARR